MVRGLSRAILLFPRRQLFLGGKYSYLGNSCSCGAAVHGVLIFV